MFALAGPACSKCDRADAQRQGESARAPSASSAPSAPAAPLPEKLSFEDIVIGKGAEAKVGDPIRIHYVASLKETGKEFDSSRARKQPFDLVLGTGRVIRGWDQGMIGMRVGGTREVTIPPSFGYGDPGAPPLIPPKATLVFEIELLSIQPEK